MKHARPEALENQLLDTLAREHIKPTHEIVKHLYSVGIYLSIFQYIKHTYSLSLFFLVLCISLSLSLSDSVSLSVCLCLSLYLSGSLWFHLCGYVLSLSADHLSLCRSFVSL